MEIMNTAVRVGGAVLVALGILVIVIVLVAPELVQGLSLDTGAVLLAGGLLVLVLSGLTAAVDGLRAFVAGEDQSLPSLEPNSGFGATASEPAEPSAKSEPMRSEPQIAPDRAEPEIISPVSETRKTPEDRLSFTKDKSRTSIDQAVEDVTEYAVSATPEGAASEEELYVVEERTIAGKPARILSDGTVEAETDDGWMRFENVEHLEEYVDALRGPRG
jgi:hypothetical protein